jgi:hypothetical protein
MSKSTLANITPCICIHITEEQVYVIPKTDSLSLFMYANVFNKDNKRGKITTLCVECVKCSEMVKYLEPEPGLKHESVSSLNTVDHEDYRKCKKRRRTETIDSL